MSTPHACTLYPSGITAIVVTVGFLRRIACGEIQLYISTTEYKIIVVFVDTNYLVVGVRGAAKISGCGKYRYWLTRQWGQSKNKVVWVMLNPSTADAEEDDPTIRKCVGFARVWSKGRVEYGGIVVVNLFAYRATNPKELKETADPFGPHNHTWQDAFLAPKAGNLIVAAWGAHGSLYDAAQRFKDNFGSRVMCLGYTTGGEPRHPLMVPYSTPLEPFK